jgi:hypothetical protein
MTHVLTLIAGRSGDLSAALVETAASALRAAGAEIGETVWLAPGLACDRYFRGLEPAAAEAAARLALTACRRQAQAPARRRHGIDDHRAGAAR